MREPLAGSVHDHKDSDVTANGWQREDSDTKASERATQGEVRHPRLRVIKILGQTFVHNAVGRCRQDPQKP